ncbi:MAG: hypothetical protein MUO85_07835, partial [candidate division Zixibacteria bacterium]|nr:hypothetical protein [candidate division Zixibacteria bacterium]
MKKVFLFLSVLVLGLFTSFALGQDTGVTDTVRVECIDKVRPNSQVVLNVYMWNDETIGGFSIPLAFPDSLTNLDITCDSISFVGTRASGADAKSDSTAINNGKNRANVWAIWILSTPLQPGSSVVGKIYFRTGATWDSTRYVPVDSTLWPPVTTLECTNGSSGIGFIPAFVKGCLGVGGPSITVTSPNGGEVWYVGENHNITWTSRSFTGSVKIEYSTNGGSSWTTIIASTPDDGSHPWTIPNYPTSQGKVRVSDAADGIPYDISDANFSIPDFTNGATPASRTIDVGASTNYTVNLVYLYGFAHPCTLSVSGLPSGASSSFSKNPVTPPTNSSVLTINTTSSTPAGTYTLTIQGKGSQTHTTTVTLVVDAAPAAFSLISPDSGSTVSTLTPTLRWHKATDPDPLDTVKYILYYTRKADFTPPYDSISGISDTFRV